MWFHRKDNGGVPGDPTDATRLQCPFGRLLDANMFKPPAMRTTQLDDQPVGPCRKDETSSGLIIMTI